MEIVGAGLHDLYQIGIRMDVYSAAGAVEMSGEQWLSTFVEGDPGADAPYGLHLIPPSALADLSSPPPPPYRYILTMHNETGYLRIDHTDALITSTRYNNRYSCYLTWAGFPSATLSVLQTSTEGFVSMSTNVGFAEGDILYVEDEQMRINMVVFGTTINVDRGVNGTTAVEHAMGTLVRGTVQQDMLHVAQFWDVHNTLPNLLLQRRHGTGEVHRWTHFVRRAALNTLSALTL